MHPKLNWENFEAVYGRRKRRRRRVAFILWTTLGFGALLGGYFAFFLTPGSEEVKDEIVNTQSLDQSSTDSNTSIVAEPLELETMAASVEPKVDTSVKDERTDASTSTKNQQNTLSDPSSAGRNDIVGSLLVEERSEERVLSLGSLSLVELPVSSNLRMPKRWFEERIEPHDEGDRRMGYSLGAAVIPYHSPWLTEGANRAYLPFTSPSIQFNMSYPLGDDWNIRSGFEWTVYRYQAQLVESYQTSVYKPGSIVRYVQRGSGFDPVYSDTVKGTITRRYHENGNLQVISLPVQLSYDMLLIGNLQMSLSAGVNLDYLYSSTRAWMSDERITTTSNAIGRDQFIPSLQTSIELRYPFGNWGISTELRTGARWSQQSADISPFNLQVRTGVFYGF